MGRGDGSMGNIEGLCLDSQNPGEKSLGSLSVSVTSVLAARDPSILGRRDGG